MKMPLSLVAPALMVVGGETVFDYEWDKTLNCMKHVVVG